MRTDDTPSVIIWKDDFGSSQERRYNVLLASMPLSLYGGDDSAVVILNANKATDFCQLFLNGGAVVLFSIKARVNWTMK